MTVYHASNVEVGKPMMVEPNRMLDFGPGFYATTNREQAIRFAKSVVTTVLLYMRGFMSREATIAELRVHRLYDQLIFATPVSLAFLDFIKAEAL